MKSVTACPLVTLSPCLLLAVFLSTFDIICQRLQCTLAALDRYSLSFSFSVQEDLKRKLPQEIGLTYEPPTNLLSDAGEAFSSLWT